jgi:hypothetical protein
LKEVVISDDHKKADSQNGAIYRDERKKNPELYVELRQVSVHGHFYNLNRCGDYDDKNYIT